MLKHWNETKDRYLLKEVEYLTLFGNTTDEIISLLIEELHCSNLNLNNDIINEVTDKV